MKRAFIIVAVAVLAAVSCAACGAGDVTASGLAASSSAASSTVSSAVSEQSASSSTTTVDAAKYADNVTGLATYMGACGYVEGGGLQLEYQLIGAKNGYRYSTSVNHKATITVEFYEYDKANLNDTAKKTLDSVKQNGYFTLFNKNVNASLSDNGKYLMIYKDTDTSDAHNARTKEAIKKFKAFKA
ncbi:MAG: hypothetical protein LKF71_00020 [Oscillospiraceae bacterium]|nr:hypothetical protein [Oscillospiraceae bacterium]